MSTDLAMRITIRFPNGIAQADLDRLTAIQAGGAVITYQKYRYYTPGEFAREHGMQPTALTRLFRRADCPEIKGDIGPTGRVQRFLNTEILVGYLLRHRRVKS